MIARPRLLVVLSLLAFGALGCPEDGPPAPTADTSAKLAANRYCSQPQ